MAVPSLRALGQIAKHLRFAARPLRRKAAFLQKREQPHPFINNNLAQGSTSLELSNTGSHTSIDTNSYNTFEPHSLNMADMDTYNDEPRQYEGTYCSEHLSDDRDCCGNGYRHHSELLTPNQ